jgi:hypothetical protein
MRKLIIYITFIVFLISCIDEPIFFAPEPAILTFPLKNESCNTGLVLSETKSTITFRWENAKNATRYELSVKNLLTNQVVVYKTTLALLAVELNRNTPYSWFVNSFNENSLPIKSEEWKFYNAGVATTSFSPFPAEIVVPKMGETLMAENSTINLIWSGLDLDNDISSYDIYFGTSANPPFYKNSTSSAGNSTRVQVGSNTTYYWKIITKDSKGSSSDSGIFKFTVI